MRAAPIAVLASLVLTAPASARTWADSSGKYSLDASLVAFDDEHVILQRDADGALGRVVIAELSDADREYLAGEGAIGDAAAFHDGEQIWTLRSGLRVPGRLLDYTRREVVIKRRDGKIYVNGRQFENLPPIYKRIVPLVVGEFEGNRVTDAESLEKWMIHKKGQPQGYTVDGVVMELESGDEYAVPFFLFDQHDLEVLQPGWEAWLAASGDYDTQQDASLEVRSLAAAYQRDSEQRNQIARLQLGLQAVEVGLTSLWEVTLYAPVGSGGAPVWVVVPGRDSRVAQQNALAQYPGYLLGPARRVSR